MRPSRLASETLSTRALRHVAARLTVLLILMLIAGAVFVAPALAAGSVGGLICDEFVMPIENARVDVWRSPDNVSEYVWLGMDLSDSTGAYTVPTPGAGWYKVAFSDPLARYASEWWGNRTGGIEEANPIWLNDGQDGTFVNAVLDPAGRAGGVVMAAGGGPLENIRIDVFRWSDWAQDWIGTAASYSGADGSWSVAGLTPGQFRFHFRDEDGGVYADQFYDHQRFWDHAHSVSIGGGMNADWINADLEVGAQVGGVVRDEGGLPIAGVQVVAFGQNNWGDWPGVRSATTNVFGQYTLGPLASGDYRVWFDGGATFVSEYWNDRRYDWEAVTVSLVAGQNFGCDATLAASGAIAGHVEADDSHGPLEGIEVSVAYWVGWDFGGWEEGAPLATTDAGGDYTITGLAPGIYRVGFRDPDADWAGEWYDDTLFDWAADVAVSGAQTTSVDASLAPAGHIAGVVRDTEGNPIPSIDVSACRFMGDDVEEQWRWGWNTRADETGFFSLDGLAAGRYQIELRDQDGVYAVQVYEDALNSGEGIDLVVEAGGTTWAAPVLERGGGIYGQVVDENGDPLTSVQVSMHGWVDRGPEGSWWEWYEECYTDERGEFSASGLQARPTALFFQDDSGRCVGEWYNDAQSDAEATPVEVRAERRYNIGRVVLAEGAHIAGTVTATGGGGSLENIEVTIARWRADWGDWEQFTGAQSDAEGHYDIGGIAAGSYRVRFWDGSGAYAGEWFENAPDPWSGQDVAVTAGDTTTVDAALEQACIIEGHVRDGAANPLPGIEAVLYYREAGGEWAQYQFDNEERIFTDEDGYFRLAGLPASTYQLMLDGGENPGGWAAEVFDGALVVGAGTDLDLSPGETRTVDPVLDHGGLLAGRLLDDESFIPLSFAFPMEIGVWTWLPDAGPDGGSWQRYAGYATGDGTDGYMHGPHLAPGEYRLDFSCWTGSYVYEAWQDQPDIEHATPVTIVAGQETDLGTVLLQRSAMIFGHVTGPSGEPVGGVEVRQFEFIDGRWEPGYDFQSWSDGFYLLGEMAGGTYRVEFDGRGVGLSREYWDNAASVLSGTGIVLAPREEVYGIDVQLEAAGGLEGTVRTSGGELVVGAPVRLAQWDEIAGGYVDIFDMQPPLTDENGFWRMDSVSPGTYRVTAGPSGAYAAGSVEGVVVSAEQTTTADVTLPVGASISGTVTDAAGLPVAGVGVAVATGSDAAGWNWAFSDFETSRDGAYTLAPVSPGTYKVVFGWPHSGTGFAGEFWDNRSAPEAAEDVTVGAGDVVTGIDAALGVEGDTQPPSAPEVTGADELWHSAPVELAFSATDDLSGVEEYEYAVDGGAWRHGQHPTIGAPADHANDGAHTIVVRAVDFAGNPGPTTEVQVKIDTTGPAVSDDDPGLWLRGPVTVNLSANDAGIGVVDHLEYGPTAEGPWATGTSFTLATWKRGGGSGERTTWVRGIDGLGNASDSAPVVVRLDGRAPTTTHDSNGLPHATNVTVHLTLNDAHAGPGWTYFSVDGGMWMIGDAVTIPALAGGQNDGVHTIWFYSVDAVGNVEQARKWCSVVIDVPGMP